MDRLFRFVRQNRGKLSNRACDKEFAQLTDAEAAAAEEAFAACFGDDAKPDRAT